jgi:hypothetical protein
MMANIIERDDVYCFILIFSSIVLKIWPTVMKRSSILLVKRLLRLLISLVVRLEVLPVLDGVIRLEEKVSDTVLLLKIERTQGNNIVVVDNLPYLPVKRLDLLTSVQRRLAVLVNREILRIFFYFLFVLHKIALGQHSDRWQFQCDLYRQRSIYHRRYCMVPERNLFY